MEHSDEVARQLTGVRADERGTTRRRPAGMIQAIGVLGAVALVAVAAVAYFNRPSFAPVAGASTQPSQTPPPASMTRAATPSLSLSSPTPVASGDGWTSLGRGFESASWSPDGRHIALVRGGNTAVLTATGEQVQQFEGADGAVWVDPARLLLIDRTGDPIRAATNGGKQGAPVYLADLVGSEPQLVGYVDAEGADPLSSGAGAVAFGSPAGAGSFVIWSSDGWSPARPGYPLAWSAQGDKLAVLHLRQARIGLEGTPEVLAWPSLEPLASDPDNATSPNSARFDPAGDRLAYMSYGSIHVLDTGTAKVTVVGPLQAGNWFGWNDQQQLVIADRASGSVSAYGLDDSLVETWTGLGHDVVSTPEGSVILFFTRELPREHPPFNLLRDGVVTKLDFSGIPNGPPPMLAPDGHAILVISSVGNEAFLSPAQ